MEVEECWRLVPSVQRLIFVRCSLPRYCHSDCTSMSATATAAAAAVPSTTAGGMPSLLSLLLLLPCPPLLLLPF